MGQPDQIRSSNSSEGETAGSIRSTEKVSSRTTARISDPEHPGAAADRAAARTRKRQQWCQGLAMVVSLGVGLLVGWTASGGQLGGTLVGGLLGLLAGLVIAALFLGACRVARQGRDDR